MSGRARKYGIKHASLVVESVRQPASETIVPAIPIASRGFLFSKNIHLTRRKAYYQNNQPIVRRFTFTRTCQSA